MSTEIYQRIVIVRKRLRITQEKLAARLHMSRTNIANIELGRTRVTERLITDICREFDVSEVWLRTGEGEMFQNRTERVKLEMALDLVRKMPENSSIKRLVMSLADLSLEDLEQVERFASLMGEVLRRK